MQLRCLWNALIKSNIGCFPDAQEKVLSKFESCSDSFRSTNIHCKCYICYVWPIFLMELYTYIDMPSHNSVVRAANNTCKYVIMQMYEEELFTNYVKDDNLLTY